MWFRFTICPLLPIKFDDVIRRFVTTKSYIVLEVSKIIARRMILSFSGINVSKNCYIFSYVNVFLSFAYLMIAVFTNAIPNLILMKPLPLFSMKDCRDLIVYVTNTYHRTTPIENDRYRERERIHIMHRRIRIFITQYIFVCNAWVSIWT